MLPHDGPFLRPDKRFPDVKALQAQCEALISAGEWADDSAPSTVPHMQSWQNQRGRVQMASSQLVANPGLPLPGDDDPTTGSPTQMAVFRKVAA